MCKHTIEERACIHWLYHVPGIGRKRMGVILSSGVSLPDIVRASENVLFFFLRERCGFSEKASQSLSEQIIAFRKKVLPQRLWEKLCKKEILFLLPEDPGYPERLKDIPDAPFALYMKGDKQAAKAFSKNVPVAAVVGARECSEYGKAVAEEIGKCCARLGIALSSGMAYGIDGIAQSAALRGGGLVAAVLGCGCDICYPESNGGLYKHLSEQGCIFSEYIPGTEPKANYFPPRNRIISGMADVLIVVEAKEKSGTLITVDMALEQGKEVYVVPGRITDPMSRGCNRLLGQGACVLYNIEETLTEIGGICRAGEEINGGTEIAAQRNPYEKGSLRYIIYNVLDIQPKPVQQIYEEIHRNVQNNDADISRVQSELFFMQMEGRIRGNDGCFFLVPL